MFAVFFDGKDAGHVGKHTVRLIFQQIPEKVEILFLRLRIHRVHPENTIPFINHENKITPRLGIDFFQNRYQILLIICDLWKLPFQFPHHFSGNQFHHILHGFCTPQKLLHIQMNRIVLIQMLFKIRIFCKFKGFKQFIGIIPFSIICHQHICRHGFPETAGTADADVLMLRF